MAEVQYSIFLEISPFPIKRGGNTQVSQTYPRGRRILK